MKIFTKKATAVAILAALTVSGQTMAAPTVYGKAHLSIGSTSEEVTGSAETSATTVASHASRLGFKGSLDTDGTTKVTYKMEWQVDMSDKSGGADNIKGRSQYVGLKDSWGEVRVGRDDSPYKKAGTKNVEHLGDGYADYNNIINKDHDSRTSDSITFWSKLGPGKLGLQYATGDDHAGSGEENESDLMAFAYDMKMGGIGFAIAYSDQGDSDAITKDGSTATKFVFGYKMRSTQFGIVSESVDYGDDGDADEDNMLVSIKQGIGDKGAIKFAYGTKSIDGVTDDATMTALAYEHKMSKKVSMYGLYASGSDNGLKANSKLEGDGNAIVVGLIAKF